MKKFDVRVNSARTAFSTTYEVIGEKAECEAWLEHLQRAFPAAGYGTYGRFVTELPDGDHVMSAWRSNSCD